MEFLRLVEDDLRALSVEARKKHPMVKEAAERGIVKLRALREQYAATVRESGESPPMSKLRSQDLLRPFLLACNHADCSKTMILHALGAMAHLINRGAISPSDAPNILRVLAIQAAVSSTAHAPEVHVKVLQTLLLTVTWQSCELPEEMLASALIVCIQLSDHRNATVRNAASATLRQVVSQIFDRVGAPVNKEQSILEEQLQLIQPSRGATMRRASSSSSHDVEGEEEGLLGDWSESQAYNVSLSDKARANEPESLRSVERCAYYLIQDLCLLSRGEQGTWIKHMTISPTLGVELIDQIISLRPKLFRERAIFGDAIRNQVCPLIVQTLRSGMDFPLLVRLMRIVSTVVGELADLLVPQCEVILSMLLQLVAGSEILHPGGVKEETATNSLIGAAVAFGTGGLSGRGASNRLGLWSVMLALEVFVGVCGNGWLVQTVYQNYDLLSECTNVLAAMVKGLTRFVIDGAKPTHAATSLAVAADAVGWNPHGLPILSRGFELLKEGGPPAITEGEVLLNGINCLLGLVDTIWSLVLNDFLGGTLQPALPSSSMYHSIVLNGPIDGARSPGHLLHQIMVKEDTWRDMMLLFVNLLSNDGGSDRLYEGILLGYERFCLILGMLSIVPAESQMMSLLAQLAVPSFPSEATSLPAPSMPSTFNSGSSIGGTELTGRHWIAIRSLLRTVAFLANGLDESWDIVVKSFDLLDATLYIFLPSSAPSSGSITQSQGLTSAVHESSAASTDEQKVVLALRKFVSFSVILEDKAFLSLAQACISLSKSLLQVEQLQSAPGRPSDDLPPSQAPNLGSNSGAGNASTSGPGFAPSSSLERSSTYAAFILKQLIRMTTLNIYRVGMIWEAVGEHLSFVASCRGAPLRLYAVTSLTDLVVKALSRTADKVSGPSNHKSNRAADPAKATETATSLGVVGLIPDLDTVFTTRGGGGGGENLPELRPNSFGWGQDKAISQQVIILRPLASLGSSSHLDTREHALNALYRVLQSCGHVLDAGWPEVFDIFRSVAMSEETVIDLAGADGDGVDTLSRGDSFNTIPPLWGIACLPLAFRSLKLIVDDNLDSIPKHYLGKCVSCMGSFAHQVIDINISLTAIGMIWTVADFVSQGRSPNPNASIVDVEKVAIWKTIFEELGRLALDWRPEVRNCAVNTLFSCIVSHGAAFSLESWEARMQVIAALVHAIESKASTALSPLGTPAEGSAAGGASDATPLRSAKRGPKVVMHHSRDTAQKQWSETRVLALQGLGRLHRAFLRSFWSQQWHPALWRRTLEMAKSAITLGSRAPNAEVALAGVTLLFMLLQLASKAGLAHGPIRAAVGMKVVDGALQADSSAGGKAANQSRSLKGFEDDNGDAFEVYKAKLWEEAWTVIKEAADSYAEDQDGEIAGAFAINLQMIYDSSKNAELQGVNRMLELLVLVGNIVEARSPRSTKGEVAGDTGENGRPIWRPPVLSSQREVLNLLRAIRSDEPNVWHMVFGLLSRYADMTGLNNKVSNLGLEEGLGSSSSQKDSNHITRIPVSKQFAKEAAGCLTALLEQDYVPMASKAILFDPIVQFLGDACLKCALQKRTKSRSDWFMALSQFASRHQPSTSIYLLQSPAVYQASGSVVKSILRQGLMAVQASINPERGESLLQAWHDALLVVEGYLIPWNVGDPSESSSSIRIAYNRATYLELHTEAYTSVGQDLLRIVLDVTVSALDAFVFDGAADRVMDILIDVVLAQGAVEAGLAAALDTEHQQQQRQEAKAEPELAISSSLVLFKLALGYLRSLLHELLERAERPKSKRHKMAAIAGARRLVARLLHMATWILERYVTESKNDGPTRAYTAAEAHVLQLLDFLKTIEAPTWTFPSQFSSSRGGSQQQGSDATALLPDWCDPQPPSPPKSTRRRRGESQVQTEELSSILVKGHVFLLAPALLPCLVGSGSSSIVRAAVTDLLTEADLSGSFSSMQQVLHQAQTEIATLREELTRLSVSSVAGFF